MAYNTGNPVPSTDARDLSDNCASMDEWINSTSQTMTTRTAAVKKTLAGIEAILDATSLPALESIRDDISAALLADDAAYATLADVEAIVSPAAGDVAYTYAEPTTNNPIFYRYTGSAWVELWDPSATTGAIDARVTALEEGAPSVPARSVRFYERNLQGTTERSGTLFQSKTGLPQILGAGNSIIFKCRIPHELTAQNQGYQIMGSGTQGGYIAATYYGEYYFGASLIRKLRVQVRANGTATAYTIDTSAFTSTNVLIAVSDNGSTITVRVTDCITGAVVATGSTAGTVTGGVTIFRDGITLGASYGYNSAALALAAPSSGFIGSLSDFAILADGAPDVAFLATTDMHAALLSDYGSGSPTVGYYRKLSGPNDLSDTDDFPSSAADLVVFGDVHAGSTIGKPSAEFHVAEKPIGFIGAIEHPGATSAPVFFDVATNGAVVAPIDYRLYDSAAALVASGRLLTPSAGTASYSARLDMPVKNDWMTLVFDNGTAEQVHANGITAGVVVHTIGQSQQAILWGASDAGIERPPRVASLAFLQAASTYPTYSQIRRADPLLVRDGFNAFLHRWFECNDVPICVVADAVAGTGVDQWLDDADTTREWSASADLVGLLDGRVSAHLWQWVTNNMSAGADYVTKILMPALDGIATTGGAAAAVPVVDHYLYDGLTFKHTPSLIISPPTGHRSDAAGPFDYDAYSTTLGNARDAIVAWAEANGHTVGPYINDLLIANNGVANTGGPHQHPNDFRGNPRIGIRMAEAVCRWNGSSKLKNPTVAGFKFADAGNTTIDMTVTMPNFGRLQTDGGAITGIELSSDAGVTWSRSGFTAAIINSKTVRLTKSVGSWSAGLRARYQAYGPFSYGTSVDELTTIRGALYDGSQLDGSALGDSLGVPVAGSTTVYTVETYA